MVAAGPADGRGGPVGPVTCPHCFHVGDRDQLHYHCGGRCRQEPGGAVPFPAAQLRSGRCPHGRPPQARRHCRGCGRPLPREYLDGDRHLVALIGPPACGKSTFVGVLVHELREGSPQRLGGLAADLLGDGSRRRYRELLGDPLYGQGRTPSPTMPTRHAVESARHDPLLVALRPGSARGSPFRSRPVPSAVLAFYDTAGEDVSSAESVEFLGDYLGAAQGVILMLDAGSLLARSGGGPDPADAVQVPLEYLIELGRRRVPVAVVLSKIDLLVATDDEFGPWSPLRRPSRHLRRFDHTDSLDVHEEIRAWLTARGIGALDRTLQASLAHFRYFGLTALGHAPVGGSRIAAGGIRPYRVEDPLLWLLAFLQSRSGIVRRR